MARSENRGNGPDDAKVQKNRKAATAMKGRHKQPRGKAGSKAMAIHSKPQKNPSRDMEF